MNACREWKSDLLEYAAGTANDRGTGSSGVEAHIKGCAVCAAALAGLREQAVRLDTALPGIAEGAELREGFEARVFARIAAGDASAKESRLNANWLSGWRMRLAVAGMVCAVVASVMWPTVKKRWHIGEEPAFSISTWRSPTDSLLRTPGQELMQGTPKLGEVYFSMGQVSKEVKK
jgi:anti-sigma-K factor RskA